MNEPVDHQYFHAKPLRFQSMDAYIDWALQQEDRFELFNGEVVPVASERNLHNLVKQEIWFQLRTAVRAKGLDLTVLGDGATVQPGPLTAYEPDVTVQIGATVDLDSVFADAPLIVVEVLSPSTSGVDKAAKFGDYFRLPTVQHYLIVDPDNRRALHHRRADAETIVSSIHTSGKIALEPPGIVLDLDGVFPEG